eukprot:TRINITY_DN9166_c0_g1_i2.p1 TRINITY_DN9166_c0_g1~~TRINITY_DN9166_c0_g1_i2.p1  ORF type:complete len:177 (-),score=54.77 TRINITY_DN9166_c0_g1_i2:90-620(-)
MIRRPPRSTQSRSSAASDVYKRQAIILESAFERFIALDGIRLIAPVPEYGTRLCLRREASDDLRCITAPQNQRGALLLQGVLKCCQTFMQPPPGSTAMGTLPGCFLVQDKEGNDRSSGRHGRCQRRIVAQSEILTEPDNDRFFRHAHTPLKTPYSCLLYTSPSPRDRTRSRMPSSA